MTPAVMKADRNAWLIAVLFPIVLNSLCLFNILKSDPVLRYSGIQTGVVPGPVAGLPVIDPNQGFTSQALGKRSADEILHGKMPWWNSDAGVGLPLAGEMQPASFFPLTPLQELPNGQMIIDVVVQILAGVFMMLFLRRLGVGTLASAVGALLFECNGTFAWLIAMSCYPLPLLPLLLYGIELAIGSTLRERVAGTLVVAAAVCISITAAMIEVAYLNSLLGVAWALLRLAQTSGGARAEQFMRLLFGATIGLLIAAPLLIAFVDYLSVSYVGMHAGGSSGAHLVPGALLQTLLPYIWGPIFYFGNATISSLWGSVGGYIGITLAFFAVCGLFGSYKRGLRALLGGWVLATYAATIGVSIVQQLLTLVPGMKYVAYYRYFDGSREFAVAVLVALLIYDVGANRGRDQIRYALATLLIASVLLLGLMNSSRLLTELFPLPGFSSWFWGSIGWAILVIVIIWLIVLKVASAKQQAYTMAGIVVLEAATNWFIPTLAYPQQGHLADGSVKFLKAHLGLQRLYGLGTIAPNYGSFFDIAQINHNALPIASAWVNYVREHLDPFVDPISFTGDWPVRSGDDPGRDAFLRKNLSAFENIGVKYVVSWRGVLPLSGNFDEPVNGRPIAPLRFLDTHGSVQIRLEAVPAGSVTEVDILQGNYGGTANGQLELRVCSQDRCVLGHRALSESVDNQFFPVHLDRPLLVVNGGITIATRQAGASVSDAVWLFAAAPSTSERVIVGGKELQGRNASIRLRYNSLRADVPADLQRKNYAAFVRNGQSAEAVVSGAHVPSGVIDAMGVLQGSMQGTADGQLRLRICSMGRCSQGVRSLANTADNDFLWFALDRPLRVGGGKVEVRLDHAGGRVPEGLWLRPELAGPEESVTVAGNRVIGRGLWLQFDVIGAAGPGQPVFHDQLVDIDELPNPAPYFSAAGCVLNVKNRELVEARCSRPATLTRREFYLAGWTARVNGTQRDVSPASEIFQSVALPAGASIVAFAFTPPNMDYGYAAFTLGALTFAYQLFMYLRLRPLRNR
jgi:hypothetical protein